MSDDFKKVINGHGHHEHHDKKHHKRTEGKVPEKKDGSNDLLDDITNQLKAAEEEAKGHYDKLLRAMAELDNVKKRTEREKSDAIKYSNEKLITELLPVMDSLDKVLHHLPENPSRELTDFVAGVDLVAKQMATVLSGFGLEEVKTDCVPFSPVVHEAVSHLPCGEVKEGEVIECHRKGYTLNGRLLRPAMVSVSKGKC